MGFEPTRAEHIGLAVQRLNHSATSSGDSERRKFTVLFYFDNNKCMHTHDYVMSNTLVFNLQTYHDISESFW